MKDLLNPAYRVNVLQPHTGMYARPVAIIGVGKTKFGQTLSSPWLEGYSERDLSAWAGQKAMEDAGINGSDVDALIMCSVTNAFMQDLLSPQVFTAEWLGMRGKPTYFQEAGCAGSYTSFDTAVQMVASGKHNIVMAMGSEVGTSWTEGDMPAHFRFPLSEYQERGGKYRQPRFEMLLGYEYNRFNGTSGMVYADGVVDAYKRHHNYTAQQIDEMLNRLRISMGRNAARDPNAFLTTEVVDLAKAEGFDDPMKFLSDDTKNPHMIRYHRRYHMQLNCEGSAAVIVAPLEMVKQFKKQSVEVLGVSLCAFSASVPHTSINQYSNALKRLSDTVKVDPKEYDLFMCSDLMLGEVAVCAEMSGYLPEGGGMEIINAGETAYDGEKPINTNGGATSFGHAYAASGLGSIGESVMQMRGEAGDRQVKRLPEVTALRGFGGGMNGCAMVMRTVQ